MRRNEAEWIAGILAQIPTDELSPLLELGSQTLHYRTVMQPHIEEILHRPLRERGVKIVTFDIQDDLGVDIVGDIYDPQVQETLRGVGAKFILCSGIIPHVRDHRDFAKICASIAAPGTRMIVTTAKSYPYTPDPIDNGARPSPQELAALFPQTKVMDSNILVSQTYLDELRKAGSPMKTLLAVTAKSIMLRGGVNTTRQRVHRLLWLFRPFTVSAVVLQKL